jgi:hypothetical protein
MTDLESLAAEAYPGIPEAPSLLRASVTGTPEERQAASKKLVKLDRQRILRGRADRGTLDADTWEDEPELAKADDFSKPDEGPCLSLPAFLARARSQSEPAELVGDLIPDEGVVIWHGRPRSMKTLTAEAVALDLTLGRTTALDCVRFAISEAVRLFWLSEEDAARLTAFRLGLMLAARDTRPGEEPECFRLAVRPGWNLEAPHGQAELLRALEETEPHVLVVDPLRASLPSIDGSPKDAANARAFLLQVLRETSVRVIWGIHHDTKPRADGQDVRARAERASGGVTFSMADCLINFERQDDRTALAVPSSYKLGSDPKPFRVSFESETPPGEGFRGFLRATAETVDEGAPVRERVLETVRANPWLSTAEVEREAGLRRKGEGARYLAQLEAGGLVFRATGAEARDRGRSANAVLWRPAGEGE